MKREEIRDIIRYWLELQIKSTKGGLVTVKAKRFFNWLGRKTYCGTPSVVFWQLVESVAPELGLKVVERDIGRNGCSSKIVFLKP